MALEALDLPPALQSVLEGLSRQTLGIETSLRRHLPQGGCGQPRPSR